MLLKLLRQRAPRHPYRSVTRRNHFDEVVAEHIEALRPRQTVEQLEEEGEQWRAVRTALALDFVPAGQGIHSTRDLYLEQHLWVAPAATREPSHWHAAMVVDVNEAYFYIRLQDAEPVVRTGTKILCRMWREDDGRYAFDCILAATADRPEPGVWMLQHTGDLRRTQARAHYRVTHEQPADIGIIEAPVSGNTRDVFERPEVARVHGRIISISGGGFAVSVAQPLPPQVLLRLLLQLDEPGAGVMVAGRVVGSQSLFGGRYLIRCAFIEMSDEQREHITQYVFRRQTHVPRTEA